MNKKVMGLSILLAMLLGLTACAEPAAQPSDEPAAEAPAAPAEDAASEDSAEASEDDVVKMAFLFSTSVNDGGWITSHNLGRLAADELPGVETTYLDNIDESNGWKYINDFAQQGYDIILPCSYGYMEDTLDVANSNPDTIFEHCSGYLTSENMGNYFGRDYEAIFLTGIVAGAMSETNTLGYVVSYPTPQVIRSINAFAAGARVGNPEAVVKLGWVLSWYDPTLEREAAESLIAADCDVIGAYMNSPTVLQTCASAGIYATSSQADMSEFGAEAQLLAQTWDWGVMYSHFAQEVQAGTWEPESLFWGIQEGLVDISTFGPAVPQDVQDLTMEYYDKLKAGDMTASPFYGEIKDQSGAVRIEAGRDATVEELMAMDYLIDNVEGSLPS